MKKWDKVNVINTASTICVLSGVILGLSSLVPHDIELIFGISLVILGMIISGMRP